MVSRFVTEEMGEPGQSEGNQASLFVLLTSWESTRPQEILVVVNRGTLRSFRLMHRPPVFRIGTGGLADSS
jgi:ribosomal protein RSM22 (predicted rRNA methylase)